VSSKCKLVDELLEIFRKMGLRVFLNTSIKGTSGIRHFFDVVVFSEDVKTPKVTVTIVEAGNVKASLLLELIAKGVDVKCPHILVLSGQKEFNGIFKPINYTIIECSNEKGKLEVDRIKKLVLERV